MSEPFDYGTKRADGQFERHPTSVPADKKFIRPVRRSYKHVGRRPEYPLRELTPEEKSRYADYSYTHFEKYPDGHALDGCFWTEARLKSGCGVVTTMPIGIAETYAANPGFYGSTFCCGCGKYFPVGQDGEFVWDDDSNPPQKVGT